MSFHLNKSLEYAGFPQYNVDCKTSRDREQLFNIIRKFEWNLEEIQQQIEALFKRRSVPMPTILREAVAYLRNVSKLQEIYAAKNVLKRVGINADITHEECPKKWKILNDLKDSETIQDVQDAYNTYTS